MNRNGQCPHGQNFLHFCSSSWLVKKAFQKKEEQGTESKPFYRDNDLEELHFLFASFVLFKVDKIQFWTSFIKDIVALY